MSHSYIAPVELEKAYRLLNHGQLCWFLHNMGMTAM